MPSLANAFNTFKDNLNIKSGKKEQVHCREKRLREALLEDPAIKEVFISGSYARGTAIAPLNDVDLMVVLTAKPEGPAVLKHQIESLIRPIYNDTIHIRSQNRSLGIRFEDIPFDIVPAVNHPDPNGGYWIADGYWNWLRTNPKKHKAFVQERSRQTNQRAIPLVKMIKCWNRTHNLRLKSFHLETLVLKHIQATNGAFVEACERIFRSIRVPLQNPCKDGANISDLSEYLRTDPYALRQAQDACERASKLLREAIKDEKAGNISGALAKCREVFGHPFP